MQNAAKARIPATVRVLFKVTARNEGSTFKLAWKRKAAKDKQWRDGFGKMLLFTDRHI